MSAISNAATGYYPPSWYFGPEYKKPSPSENPIYELLDRNNVHLKVGDSIDVLKYLFTPQRDYLIRSAGYGDRRQRKVYASDLKAIKYIVVYCIYIPLSSPDIVATLCNHILQVFTELRSQGKADFELVVVPRIRPDFPHLQDPHLASVIFTDFMSLFPRCLGLPLSDSDTSAKHLFSCSCTFCYTLPGSFVVDLKDQKVVNVGILAFTLFGAFFYPFTHEKLSQLWKENETLGRGMPIETILGCQTSHVLSRLGLGAGGKGETVVSLNNKVIWIYLFTDGQRLDKICDLYVQCKLSGYDFEVVLVSSLCTPVSWNTPWEIYRGPLYKNPVCWEWLELPLSDKVYRRLQMHYEGCSDDQLFIVGPNGSYVEPNAFKVYLEFGIKAYPFTKQAVRDYEVDRVQRLRLVELLKDVGICYLDGNKGDKVQVSRLLGANVVLYFTSLPGLGDDYPSWKENVPKWFEEFKRREEPFEIIIVCTYQVDDVSLHDYCSKIPWLAKIPWLVAPNNNVDRAETLMKKLAGIVLLDDTLVAFGSDGRLLTVYLQNKLGSESEVSAWKFSDPQHATNLVSEVSQRFVY